jgi:TPR repeat protein
MNSKKVTILLVFTILLIFSVVSRIFFNEFQDGWNAYVKNDYKTARELWLPLAEEGEPKAQFFLGFMHDMGFGVPENDKKAIKWYELAAEQGDPRAQLFTGFMYDSGQGVPKDYQKAVKWYQLALGQGFKQAKISIYKLAKKNSPEALKILLNDAENGSVEAQVNLAKMHEAELERSQDYQKVLNQDRISAERMREDHEFIRIGQEISFLVSLNKHEIINNINEAAELMTKAQYTLGMMYAEGQGVRDGKNSELKWYKAKEYSDKINKYNLAKNNVGQALQDLKSDAEKGVVEAQFILATMYANGRGVPQDNKKAFTWFYRVAKDKANVFNAFMLSNNSMHLNVPQELKFLTNDAESGIAIAQWKLGLEYAKGQVLPQDNEQAFKWYLLAAKQGQSDAQYSLGVMYVKGLGVLASEQEAMKWFRLYLGQTIIKLGQTNIEGQDNIYSLAKRNVLAALDILFDDANNGMVTAQSYLGDMYRDGIGVSRNYIFAYMWYNLSYNQGNDSALQQITSLKNKMTLDGIQQAQKLLKAWKPNLMYTVSSSDSGLAECRLAKRCD